MNQRTLLLILLIKIFTVFGVYNTTVVLSTVSNERNRNPAIFVCDDYLPITYLSKLLFPNRTIYQLKPFTTTKPEDVLIVRPQVSMGQGGLFEGDISSVCANRQKFSICRRNNFTTNLPVCNGITEPKLICPQNKKSSEPCKTDYSYSVIISAPDFKGVIVYVQTELQYPPPAIPPGVVFFGPVINPAPNTLSVHTIQSFAAIPYILDGVRNLTERRRFHIKKRHLHLHRVLEYTQTNCVGFREKAFDSIVDLLESLSKENHTKYNIDTTVHCGGLCCGLKYKNRLKPIFHKKTSWYFRVRPGKFQPSLFALSMENNRKEDYITEKILMAYIRGEIPIYYGSDMVFRYFDKDSFIFYDINNPAPALKQIQSLLKNHTKYLQMYERNIFVKHAVRRYFSLADDIFGGEMIKSMRKKIKQQMMKKLV